MSTPLRVALATVARLSELTTSVVAVVPIEWAGSADELLNRVAPLWCGSSSGGIF